MAALLVLECNKISQMVHIILRQRMPLLECLVCQVLMHHLLSIMFRQHVRLNLVNTNNSIKPIPSALAPQLAKPHVLRQFLPLENQVINPIRFHLYAIPKLVSIIGFKLTCNIVCELG